MDIPALPEARSFPAPIAPGIQSPRGAQRAQPASPVRAGPHAHYTARQSFNAWHSTETNAIEGRSGFHSDDFLLNKAGPFTVARRFDINPFSLLCFHSAFVVCSTSRTEQYNSSNRRRRGEEDIFPSYIRCIPRRSFPVDIAITLDVSTFARSAFPFLPSTRRQIHTASQLTFAVTRRLLFLSCCRQLRPKPLRHCLRDRTLSLVTHDRQDDLAPSPTLDPHPPDSASTSPGQCLSLWKFNPASTHSHRHHIDITSNRFGFTYESLFFA